MPHHPVHRLLLVLVVLIVFALPVLNVLGARLWPVLPTHGFRNGQAAVLVLGQSDFTSSNSHFRQQGTDTLVAVAIDPTDGKVFVADPSNHRVLRFSARDSLYNGAHAEAVFGQPDLTSTNQATAAQNTIGHPAGLVVDRSGRLWVADVSNNRVLRFDNATSKVNGADADGVLGQPDFTSNTEVATAAGMNHPFAVTVDGQGWLWVADTFNNRVLRFDNAANKANGAAANGVLGQASFTYGAEATTAEGMNRPSDVAVDRNGRLWVADESNNRVVWFAAAASKVNGAAADGVLGQSNFTSRTEATTAEGMHRPVGVDVDGSWGVWVADRNNLRVLLFEP